jgi:hypothetical protein
MLLRDDQFRQAYEAVKHELQSQDMDRKVPIFVSTVDCDSVCALRILTVRPAPGQGRHGTQPSRRRTRQSQMGFFFELFSFTFFLLKG